MSKKLGNPQVKSTLENPVWWKLWHGLNFLSGGITFVIGSILMFPGIDELYNGDYWGAVLYTIGSVNFLIADVTEWFHFKLGCMGAHGIFDVQDPDESFGTTYFRGEVGLNTFFSVCGSTVYLLGCVFFIPQEHQLIQGEYLCTLGSLIIFSSQSWKMYRAFITNQDDHEDRQARFQNILPDLSGFCADMFQGLGGLCYFIGTYVYFLAAQFPHLMFSAIMLFTLGGFGFLIAGFFMHYRYYIRQNPMHSDLPMQVLELTETEAS